MVEMHDAVTLAYVAGLLDGEGSIVIGVSKPSTSRGNKSPSHWLQVGVTNTDRKLIDWLLLTFGGHISDNSHSPSRKKQRPCWAWRIMGNQAKTFLEAIHPYLRIKCEQAELAIDFQTERVGLCNRLSVEELERREWYRSQIRSLTLGAHSL